LTTVTEILEAHPVRDDIDDAVLAACIQACAECTQACTSCADACLGESGVEHLVECIRADLDCADLCEATARVLSRHTGYDANLCGRPWKRAPSRVEPALTNARSTPTCISTAGSARTSADAARRPAAGCSRCSAEHDSSPKTPIVTEALPAGHDPTAMIATQPLWVGN